METEALQETRKAGIGTQLIECRLNFQQTHEPYPVFICRFQALEDAVLLPQAHNTPVKVNMSGLGAVPIWFVSWAEMKDALQDNVVTVEELHSLPSLQVGYADFFQFVQHPGLLRPQGLGNGKIEWVARGSLQDGRSFEYEVREMGIDTVSVLRHVKIEFR